VISNGALFSGPPSPTTPNTILLRKKKTNVTYFLCLFGYLIHEIAFKASLSTM